MKRLGIVSIYDVEGVIHDYLLYYIRALGEVLNRIVIVVNGYLKDEEFRKLERYTDEVYVRDNVGFDAGGYKLLLQNPIFLLELQKYDELILTNDTCFGPFISFVEIFEKMENENWDFWGMNYIDNNIFQYIQSNFLVFTRNCFHAVCSYFVNEIDDKTIKKHQICMQFERGLFCFLHEKGYRHGAYTINNTFDSYASPDCLIEKCSYPFLKKRAFEICQEAYKANLIHGLSIIEQLYTYDINLIINYLRHKYGQKFEGPVNMSETTEIHYEVTDVSQIEIINFCRKYTSVYIYGTGFWGQDIYAYYRNVMNNFCGFVVSDKYYNQQSVLGVKIYKYSHIKAKTNVGIIVGVSKATTREVKQYLGYYPNILYLWK